MKTLKWHLSMALCLNRLNDTGKTRTVRGRTVPPGEWVVWEGSDSGLRGY